MGVFITCSYMKLIKPNAVNDSGHCLKFNLKIMGKVMVIIMIRQTEIAVSNIFYQTIFD